MTTLWFIIVAVMIAIYVVMDGFDLGAGILHLFVAKTDNERRIILKAIGPVWDGNEVWLLAAGGTLYFAFPLLYASSFSGFYLPLMIVLWLLILRGLSIEFRAHIHSALWRSFWDGMFAFSSITLAIVFGAALGNVVRGVPLRADGYFFEAFWTTFTVVPDAGILDWYTVLLGLVAFFTLMNHGANYLALKTDGELQGRCRAFSARSWWGIVIFSILAACATFAIHPAITDKFLSYPAGFILPILGIAGVGGIFYFRRKNASDKNDKAAFISSSLFIIGMLASTAFGIFPVLLPASTDPQYSITIYNAAAGDHGLAVGIVWWIIGIILASGYFIYIFRSFKGKVKISEDGY
ncbi:MAG TPA: cytochrome d ubiquinol oxidase subunit II [Candidatus Kapabacteria bacterium]|nr:cytochrome d ubiquinol oxidase subunit II [Candidatus Kapabacteria bacterium]